MPVRSRRPPPYVSLFEVAFSTLGITCTVKPTDTASRTGRHSASPVLLLTAINPPDVASLTVRTANKFGGGGKLSRIRAEGMLRQVKESDDCLEAARVST